ncbi:DUF58 domain-containing protein [Halalkalibacterium ligniniphilum]|uniref:DUF58 domain-containing protein n=1 Tax=Halalkalibacterium ligniniphilum TaxID=1134413 RepID=UPI00137638E7|nr:DUF58 domain-containing protein [Halalkalibacterium ligniniphilum]
MERIIAFVRPFIKIGVLLIIVAVVFSYAMFQGGFVSWFLFYSVITILCLTLVVTLFSFRGFHVERRIESKQLRSGDSLRITLTVTKKPWHPFFYIHVRDLPPEDLGKVEGAGALFFFGLQKKLSFDYWVHDVKRGEHLFRNVEFVLSDLFGLFDKRTIIFEESKVLVYPKFQQLPVVPRGQSTKVMDGASPSKRIEEERSLAGVRSYVPGDRLSSIDWKQSARSAALMTKEFESYQGQGVTIAFDPYVEKASSASFEAAVELTASLMVSLMGKHPSVQVAIRQSQWLKLSVHDQTTSIPLRVLAKLEPTQTSPKAIASIYEEWQGSTVYYVCAELTDSLVQALEAMKTQGIHLYVCMVDMTRSNNLYAKKLRQLGIEAQSFASS